MSSSTARISLIFKRLCTILLSKNGKMPNGNKMPSPSIKLMTYPLMLVLCVCFMYHMNAADPHFPCIVTATRQDIDSEAPTAFSFQSAQSTAPGFGFVQFTADVILNPTWFMSRAVTMDRAIGNNNDNKNDDDNKKNDTDVSTNETAKASNHEFHHAFNHALDHGSEAWNSFDPLHPDDEISVSAAREANRESTRNSWDGANAYLSHHVVVANHVCAKSFVLLYISFLWFIGFGICCALMIRSPIRFAAMLRNETIFSNSNSNRRTSRARQVGYKVQRFFLMLPLRSRWLVFALTVFTLGQDYGIGHFARCNDLLHASWLRTNNHVMRGAIYLLSWLVPYMVTKNIVAFLLMQLSLLPFWMQQWVSEYVAERERKTNNKSND